MRYLQSIFVILVMAFSGCDHCYNVACNEPDVAYINGLQFQFDANSFSYEEVNEATVLRFTPGNFEQPLDTIHLKQILTAEDLSFHIPLPLSDEVTGSVPFVYGIYDNSHENAFIITDIVTMGIYPADCCCCYRNTVKTFILNGESVDRTGVTHAVMLTK